MSTTIEGARRIPFVGPAERSERVVAPVPARLLLAASVAIGLFAGFALTGRATATAAVSASGVELTHLLRAMALLKMLLAAACLAGMGWRLASAARPAWLLAYLAAAGAMAAGPGLIWDMAHLGWGAVLLHGGLACGLVLLWRDPVTGVRLEAAIAARRAGLRARRPAA